MAGELDNKSLFPLQPPWPTVSSFTLLLEGVSLYPQHFASLLQCLFQKWLSNIPAYSFFLDSRAVLCLLTQGFVGKKIILAAPCPNTQLPWPFCPATLGWCSAILIHVCHVLYSVHINIKAIFSLHNNSSCYLHFADEVIEAHRGNIQSYASIERCNWYKDQGFWLQVKCSF